MLIVIALVISACAPTPSIATSTALSLPTSTLLPSLVPSSTTSPSATPSGTVIYNFLELACQATWSNNGENLDCPGSDFHIIGSGYVGEIAFPVMEGNITLNESALLTHPSNKATFYGIFGSFPPINIKEGDEFRATIGCLYGVEAEDCNAEFSLEYIDQAGAYVDSQVTGWRWQEINDGQMTDIALDLSALAGQSVQLTLVVRDNGSSPGDYTVWINPHLWRSQ